MLKPAIHTVNGLHFYWGHSTQEKEFGNEALSLITDATLLALLSRSRLKEISFRQSIASTTEPYGAYHPSSRSVDIQIGAKKLWDAVATPDSSVRVAPEYGRSPAEVAALSLVHEIGHHFWRCFFTQPQKEQFHKLWQVADPKITSYSRECVTEYFPELYAIMLLAPGKGSLDPDGIALASTTMRQLISQRIRAPGC